jgi:hypothetical protein
MRITMRPTTWTAALSLLAVCGLSTPARADVTLVMNVTGKMVVDASGEQTTRIKGNKMRMDQTRDGAVTTVILDVDTGQMITLDAKKKEATVMTLAELQETLSKAGAGDLTMTIKSKVTPTSETKTVAGYKCTVHDVSIAVPFSMTKDAGSSMAIVMSGPACMSKDVPGFAEFKRFYATAAEKGFIFGDPRAAKGPGASMAKGQAELYKAMSEAGVAIEQATNMGLEGEGPAAAMMGRFMKGNINSTLVKVTEGDVAADLFVVPAGFKVKKP